MQSSKRAKGDKRKRKKKKSPNASRALCKLIYLGIRSRWARRLMGKGDLTGAIWLHFLHFELLCAERDIFSSLSSTLKPLRNETEWREDKRGGMNKRGKRTEAHFPSQPYTYLTLKAVLGEHKYHTGRSLIKYPLSGERLRALGTPPLQNDSQQRVKERDRLLRLHHNYYIKREQIGKTKTEVV